MRRPPSTGWYRMCCVRSVLLHGATSTTSLCTVALRTDSAPSTYISGICARFSRRCARTSCTQTSRNVYSVRRRFRC
ncbi:hypothetical protein PF007_g28314 [Phytophthora fragariae]|uniref:Secreted protein n=1 Tax=Phytophthora fragariae TaxID=53985 RepID=A0A6A3Q110_9STRA|nr:hypothetical protein PF003_g19724 [Phytophthora fragariae]KAE8925082.1 hypothetical protein PF009_g24698 [Phytophthora fragariae]KAE9066773.1 hypothetical protein PF007_g28314 [Phytophthora fragariae]KAE9099386.1 hypothetical protein PF006_g23147 [Phytophthora fragariae]KAE9187877.1 hypothetical protein PF004_g22666 [Phytophthora fragariae]